MYRDEAYCKKPDPITSTIWRYMSFAGLVSLLRKKALFFSKVSQLTQSDPYEGALSKPSATTPANILLDVLYRETLAKTELQEVDRKTFIIIKTWIVWDLSK